MFIPDEMMSPSSLNVNGTTSLQHVMLVRANGPRAMASEDPLGDLSHSEPGPDTMDQGTSQAASELPRRVMLLRVSGLRMMASEDPFGYLNESRERQDNAIFGEFREPEGPPPCMIPIEAASTSSDDAAPAA